MTEALKKKLLIIIYIATIFYSFHYFIPYFIMSNFLNTYFSKFALSLIFAGSALASIIFSNIFGKVLKKYTNYKSLIFVLIGQLFITTILAFADNLSNLLIAILFILHFAFVTLISVSINIFIEEFSDHENIGAIRGTILTIYNFGAITSPFIIGQIIGIVGFPGIFILSSLATIPLMILAKYFFKGVKEPKYKHVNLFESFKVIKRDKNIRGVISSSFVLNSFYAVVNVYLVLYITQVANVPLSAYLGLIVPVSVIPFILIPYELGKYSDELFGEKTAMLFGIFLMSIMLLIIFIFNITTSNILIWIIILFLARLGATTTETENYAYFYKKIDGRSSGLIALFQNMVNISFLFVSLIGALLINFFKIDLQVMFLIVSILGFLSIFIIVRIRDTEIKKREALAALESQNKKIDTKKEEEINDSIPFLDEIGLSSEEKRIHNSI